MAGSAVDPMMRHVQRLVCLEAVRDLPDAELLRRFLARQEQDAFAALVRRHGRLVWGVCRHVLPREQDAEDAFQAVFLVLARRAASIRKGESVGGWLYGVAYRIARKAKVMAARRQARERRAAVPDETPERDLAWRELQALLDDELHRLPEKYRAPFVLCCLEGRSRNEAAADLGWKEGTVSSRIAQARRLLEEGLSRRGVALAAALTAKALWEQTASAAVPSAVVATSTGRGAAVSSTAVALAQGVMEVSPARVLAGVLVAFLGLTVAVSVGGSPARPPSHVEAEAPTRRPGVDLNGDPLPPGAVARLGTTRFRHGNFITSIAFTPDGKQLVSHGHDGVRVWDSATGREAAQVLASKDHWINAGTLSKDGTLVVTAEQGKKWETLIRIRNRTDLKVIREFDAGVNFQSPRLSPDGKLLAGTVQKHSKSYFAEIWDVAAGKRLHSWEAHQHSVWCADFTPDGKHFVTGGDRCVRFWDATTAAMTREITKHPNVVGKLAFSPDSATLATIGMTEKSTGAGSAYYPSDNLIRVWDVASGKETHQLKMPGAVNSLGDPEGFSGLTFTPDGKELIGAGADGSLRFWDVQSGRELRRWTPGVKWGTTLLAFSPDGKTLAFGSHSIRLLDAATGKDAVKVEGAGVSVHTADVTPDGRTVVTLGDGRVTLWDATGRERGLIGGSDDGISSVRFLDGSQALLGVDREKTIRLWDVKTLAVTRRLPMKMMPSYQPIIALSPDGKTAVLQGEKGDTLVLIDLATGKEVDQLKEGADRCYGAAFAPDGNTLVYWQIDHVAYVWDLRNRKKVRQFEFYDSPTKTPRPAFVGGAGRKGWSYGAQLSPDGQLLAYGSQDGYLALHEVATGKVVRVIDKLADGPCFFAFTPDSRMLAWGGWREPPIYLTEVATGQERLRLDGHKGRVYSLQFAADGNTLVSSSQDGTGLVWDVLGRAEANGSLAAKDLDALWADLAGDAGRAFQSMRRLARSPAEAVPYLGKRLRPVPAPDAKRLASWVADLDSDVFARRKAATAELEKLGELAAEACRKALEEVPSLEAKKRLEKLLAAISAEAREPSQERLRAMRCLEVLERVGTPAAREAVKQLASGAPGAWLTRDANAADGRLAAR